MGPVAPISDIRGAEALNYRKGEKVLRCKLAACYRLASIYRWDDPHCSITVCYAEDVGASIFFIIAQALFGTVSIQLIN